MKRLGLLGVALALSQGLALGAEPVATLVPFVGRAPDVPDSLPLEALAEFRELLRSRNVQLVEPLLSNVPPSMVQEEEPPALKEALSLLETGRTNLQKGRMDEAVETLNKAVALLVGVGHQLDRLDPLVDIHLLLAQALIEQDYWDEGELAIKEALRFRPGLDLPQEYPSNMRKVLLRMREKVERMPKGSANILSEPPGGEVFLDGVPCGKTPLTLNDLLPGKHYLKVSMHGFGHVRQEMDVRAGAPEKIVASLIPPSSPSLGSPIPQITDAQSSLTSGVLDANLRYASRAIAEGCGASFVILGRAYPHQGGPWLQILLYSLQRDKIAEIAKIGLEDGSLSQALEPPAQDIVLAMSSFPEDKVVSDVALVALDVSGNKTPPAVEPPDQGKTHWYERWWIWTILGVAVAGGGVAVGLVVSETSSTAPQGFEATVRWR